MYQAKGTVSAKAPRQEGADGLPRECLPDSSRSLHDSLLWFPVLHPAQRPPAPIAWAPDGSLSLACIPGTQH